ncbi:SCO7613 C-terminal domain-containing membrane protein, partial [Streptomyces sp. NPDC002920]
SLRPVAVVCAFGAGGYGVLAAGLLSLDASGPGAAARAAALLFLAAAIALAAARFTPQPGFATGTALAGALCAIAGVGGVLRVSVPGEWVVPACLACGIALLPAARGIEPVRRGLALASDVVQAGAVLWTVPAVGVTLLGPTAWLGRVWAGAPGDARTAAVGDAFWPPHSATAPLVLAAVAVLLALRGTQWRPHALALAWAAVIVFPTALELPYGFGLLLLGVSVAALLGLGTRPAVGLALATSLSLALLSLAAETATLAVLASLTAGFAVAARRGRLAPVSAAASLGYATALACAMGASAGWRPEHTALLVLLVPVAAALLAPRIADSATTLAVESTGAVAGLVAIGLAVLDLPLLALVLSLCAVIAAGTAVRQDRRGVGYAAVVLFVLGPLRPLRRRRHGSCRCRSRSPGRWTQRRRSG